MNIDTPKPVLRGTDNEGKGSAKPRPLGGIYVHVPFCLKKCPYCNFYSITDLSLRNAYLSALEKEIALTGPVPFRFDTLYMGGGTPSVLDTGQVARIIELFLNNFSVKQRCEITLEVNPGTVSFQDFQDFRRAGVNRINIGVQSFQDKNLKFLGRIHSAAEAEKALQNARAAGFDNIGFDLMYGLPGQTVDGWLKDLQQAVSHGPRHLSCYMLSYENGTLLDRDRQRGRFRPLPDQAVGKLFEITMAFLQDNGILQYEISNYADSPDTRSRHNRKYWHFDPYLGFGPGAHSFIDPQRFWNHRDIHTYISLLNQDRRPMAGKETLSRDQQMIETIYLGLRTTDGIDLTGFEDRFRIGFAEMFAELIEDFTRGRFLTVLQGRCRLTRKGMLMLDSIAGMFVEKIPKEEGIKKLKKTSSRQGRDQHSQVKSGMADRRGHVGPVIGKDRT